MLLHDFKLCAQNFTRALCKIVQNLGKFKETNISLMLSVLAKPKKNFQHIYND